MLRRYPDAGTSMIGRLFLGRFEAKRLLGEGGMGSVYLAREFNPDRFVVVKVMHEHLASDPILRARFAREAEMMGHFRHPHAVALLDADLTSSQPCLAMEYIRGVRLDQLLKKNKRFTPARVGRLVGQVCEVLQAAHDQKIIHRDLKPSNLMVVDADTPEEQIKVMDFGLAKRIDEAQVGQPITNVDGEFAVGTPSYISPEQVRGEEMDQRGDLYSMGVIAYELLSGQLPFERASNMDMILAHATEKPPTFADLGLRNWVPKAVEQVVLSCLAKEPTLRPESAEELADQFFDALTAADEPSAVSAETVEVAGAPIDPNALVYQVDAWLPQRIALLKIRGFVHDVAGEVVESQPGLIRVRLTQRRPVRAKKGPMSWFGLGKHETAGSVQEVELRLQQADAKHENRLLVTIAFQPPNPAALHNFHWREQCGRIFCDMRAYLMGRSDG